MSYSPYSKRFLLALFLAFLAYSDIYLKFKKWKYEKSKSFPFTYVFLVVLYYNTAVCLYYFNYLFYNFI